MNIGLYFLGFVLNVDGLERNINEHVGRGGVTDAHTGIYTPIFYFN